MPISNRTKTNRAILLVSSALVVLAIAGWSWRTMRTEAAPGSAIGIEPSPPALPRFPSTPEQAYLPLDPDKAQLINSGIPLSGGLVEAARPFVVPDPVDEHSAAECLTAAVYYEAGSESDQGQRAVAQVVLNRVRHPAFPKSVCAVVYQGAERRTGCQFSFTCDGSLARQPARAGWVRAYAVALRALAGAVEPSVGTATHYHADYVVPYWAWSLDKTRTIGAHIFYRWKGYWGRRVAFTGEYAGESRGSANDQLPPQLAVDHSIFGAQLDLSAYGPPPLVNDIGRSPSISAPLERRSIRPRADQEHGTLVADENNGSLLVSGSKIGGRDGGITVSDSDLKAVIDSRSGTQVKP